MPKAKRKGATKKFTFTGLDNKEYTLTEKEKKFCEEYIKPFTSGTEAIIKAGYNVRSRNGAKELAYENLTKPHICQYLTMLIEDVGLNDTVVDKHLLYNITQSVDLKAKNTAIDIYNKKQKRYPKEQVEHTVTIVDKYKNMPEEELDDIIHGETNNRGS